jgi:hypothetical protein
MDEYRKAVINILKESNFKEDGKLGGRELLELLVRKWGVAYDLQLRKNKPFGEGSANIYINGIINNKLIEHSYIFKQLFPVNKKQLCGDISDKSHFL